MKKIFLLIIITLFLSGCTKSSKQTKLEEIIKENNYIIVDVRTEEEYEEAHLVDALNIPYDIIDETIDLDKEKTILVYCRSGNRSKIAFDILTDLGYTVYDLGSFNEIDMPKEN